MNWEKVDGALCGAVCLLLGWGLGTLLHECGHFAVARSLGLPASFGTLTLTTGSIFVHAPLTDIQTTLIAVAGSLALIIAGVAMVRLSGNPALRMIGVVFLCRAFIDTIPLNGFDGMFIAESVGYLAAYTIVIIEVLISGGVIYDMVQPAPQTLYRTI